MWQCNRLRIVKPTLEGFSGFKTSNYIIKLHSSSFIIGIKIGKKINGTKLSPEIVTHLYGEWIFDQGQDQVNGEQIAFQQTVLEKLDILMPKLKQTNKTRQNQKQPKKLESIPIYKKSKNKPTCRN